jgi:hypothetical protein
MEATLRSGSGAGIAVTMQPSTGHRVGRRLWPPGSWGMLWITTGAGLLADGVAVSISPANYSLGLWLFFLSVVLPFVIFAAGLLAGVPSPLLRRVLIAVIGVYPALIYRMSSPFVLAGFDEHLHQRTLSDLLNGSGLFASNPLLAVSSNYPGTEVFTGVIIRLTGASEILGASLVILLCRILLVMIIYEAALTLRPSHRFASLVVLFYATSAQFFFFNSQFSYQSMALPLGLGGLLLVRRAQLSKGAPARRLTVLAILALIATVVTHHLTSWFVMVFLVAWTAVTPRARRGNLARAAAAMALSVIIWTAAIASKMLNYLGPALVNVAQQFDALIRGNHGRQVFSNQAGFLVPEWQRALLVLYAVVYTFLAIGSSIVFLRKAFRGRNGAIGLLGLSTATYPLTLAAHFVPSAASLGDRASTFCFLPLALSMALIITRDLPTIANRRSARHVLAVDLRPTWILVVAAIFGLAYLGGIVLGSGPDWDLLPGPYLVSADFRGQDPETLAAVQWGATHLPPGSRIIADRVPADLLGANARLWPVAAPEAGFYFASVYFSKTWTLYDTEAIRRLNISYIYVDERLSESLPQEGYYFYAGETPGPQRISAESLSKFSRVPGLRAVYRRGPVAIYSTSSLGVRQELTGFAGHRSMGLGSIADALLGSAAATLVYALRRRLRWLRAASRDAGPFGAVIVVMAATILIGGVLFGLRAVPDPWFSVFAALTGVVFFGIARRRAGRPLMPIVPVAAGVNRVVVVGFIVGIIGLACGLRAAWILDFGDVKGILESVN